MVRIFFWSLILVRSSYGVVVWSMCGVNRYIGEASATVLDGGEWDVILGSWKYNGKMLTTMLRVNSYFIRASFLE